MMDAQKKAGTGPLGSAAIGPEVLDLLNALKQATSNHYYEFEHLPGMEGRKVPIIRLQTDTLALRSFDLLTGLIPAETTFTEASVKEALNSQIEEAVEDGTANELVDKLLGALIHFINLGCPWLRGRVHVSPETMPLDDPLHWTADELGQDLIGLARKIQDISGLQEERADQARTFPREDEQADASGP